MKAVHAVFMVVAAAFAKHLWMREVAIKTVSDILGYTSMN